MSESLVLQNTGRGQIAFMLYPPVYLEEGMPKHKRRKALRENFCSIVIPQGASVDLVEKTGLSAGILRQLPEVLAMLRHPFVRVLVDESSAPEVPPVDPRHLPPVEESPAVEPPKVEEAPAVEPPKVEEVPPPAPPVVDPEPPKAEPEPVLEVPAAPVPAPEPVVSGEGKGKGKGKRKQ